MIYDLSNLSQLEVFGEGGVLIGHEYRTKDNNFVTFVSAEANPNFEWVAPAGLSRGRLPVQAEQPEPVVDDWYSSDEWSAS